MNMKTSFKTMRARQAGFTIIEIMIGMLIGLIGIVVIMQVFAVSEGFKRTASSGTDAQVNGGIAMYMLEREIRMAGFGMNALVGSGCMTARLWNNVTSTGRDQRLAPVEIADQVALGLPAPDANTDILMVTYGTADSFVEGVQASQTVSAVSDIQINSNRESFRTGDNIVGMVPGAGAGGTVQCTVHELTRVPGATGNCTQTIPGAGAAFVEHNVTTYQNSYNACAPTVAKRNKAGGVTDAGGAVVARLNLPIGSRVFNMGGNPVAKLFAIRGGNLTMCEWFTQDCTLAANYTVIADNIVSLRAVYGEDTTVIADAVIDQWSRNARTTADQMMRTLALGIEITARSSLPEKPSSGTTCDATTTASRPDKGSNVDWHSIYTPVSGTLAGAQIDLSTSSATWQCYRYKLFQTTVPLRNTLWRP
jgi:type IV pilus assembly protein PilW